MDQRPYKSLADIIGRAIGHALIFFVLAPIEEAFRTCRNLFTPSSAKGDAQSLRALRRRVRRLYESYKKTEETSDDEFIEAIAENAVALSDAATSPELHKLLTRVARELWAQEVCDPAELDVQRAQDHDARLAVRAKLRRAEHFLSDHVRLKEQWRESTELTMWSIAIALGKGVYSAGDDKTNTALRAPLIDCVDDPARVIERIVVDIHQSDAANANLYAEAHRQIEKNLLNASGIEASQYTSTKQIVLPTQQQKRTPSELVHLYLAGTPYEAALTASISFSLPADVRFEHCHIVGGTGHGKTQLIQNLVYQNLLSVQKGSASVVVIDSHGDLIDTIRNLALFDPSAENSLADRVVLVDPNDIEFPVALNMFDTQRERLGEYSAIEREKILNGTIELYEYIFGALLGAELTQKQGVIFRYLARLMLAIPNATIHTLRELMEDGKPFKPYMDNLEGTSRTFFQTQFFHPSFNATKSQMLKRLWGVLANPAFERMFASPTNKVDLFDAMNSGKVILINTAKDLLKQEGCEIFGRFFVAMIAQAALQRAAIPKDERLDTYVYIDEAHDYFDDTIEHLLNQTRKYRVALHLAHQNLGQLNEKLKASIMASTSIKLAGGVSAKDATALAREMRTDADALLNTRKRDSHTEFACFVKNRTARAINVHVPLGAVEKLPTLSDGARTALIAQNRERYATSRRITERSSDTGALTEHQRIQNQIKQLAHGRGFHAVIEQPVLDGAGRVDVALTRGQRSIACEVSVTTNGEHELKNIEKCLAAGFDEVLLIAPDPTHLTRIENVARPRLNPNTADRVHFISPDALDNILGEQQRTRGIVEQTYRGYQATTVFCEVSPDERDTRRQALANIIARAAAGKHP